MFAEHLALHVLDLDWDLWEQPQNKYKNVFSKFVIWAATE